MDTMANKKKKHMKTYENILKDSLKKDVTLEDELVTKLYGLGDVLFIQFGPYCCEIRMLNCNLDKIAEILRAIAPEWTQRYEPEDDSGTKTRKYHLKNGECYLDLSFLMEGDCEFTQTGEKIVPTYELRCK